MFQHLRSLFLLFVSSVSLAWAQPTVQSKRFAVQTQDHDSVTLEVVRRQDDSGAVQMEAWLVQDWALAPETRTAVLFGRDLDGDGYPELWMWRAGSTIRSVFTFPKGWTKTQARDLVFAREAIAYVAAQVNFDRRLYVQVAAKGLASFFSTTAQDAIQAHEDFVRAQVDYIELKRRAQSMPEGSLDQVYFTAFAERLWDASVEEVYSRTRGEAMLVHGVEDVVLYVASTKTIQAVGRIVSWSVRDTAFPAFVERVAQGSRRLPDAAVRQVAVQFMKLSGPAARQEAKQAIRYLTARNRLALTVRRGLRHVAKVYKTGFGEWKYLIQTQTAQIGAEAWSRRDSIYDPNPIVMAKNLFSDKEFLQNFGFMTNETLLLAGIHSTSAAVSRKLFIGGIVALADSTAMNFLIKGHVEPTRTAIDTGWEVVVGNLQTLVDISALKYFTKMAARTGNPRLRLIGFAVALVDQVVGYGAYSKVTQEVEPQFELIPVMAPTLQ